MRNCNKHIPVNDSKRNSGVIQKDLQIVQGLHWYFHGRQMPHSLCMCSSVDKDCTKNSPRSHLEMTRPGLLPCSTWYFPSVPGSSAKLMTRRDNIVDDCIPQRSSESVVLQLTCDMWGQDCNPFCVRCLQVLKHAIMIFSQGLEHCWYFAPLPEKECWKLSINFYYSPNELLISVRALNALICHWSGMHVVNYSMQVTFHGNPVTFTLFPRWEEVVQHMLLKGQKNRQLSPILLTSIRLQQSYLCFVKMSLC